MQKLFSRTLLIGLLLCSFSCQDGTPSDPAATTDNFAVSDEELATEALLKRAEAYLAQPPVPLTSATSARSEGGPHDFYSEGDYWWPDPDNPDGAYIQRDGKTNPDNFVAHRQAMRKLNEWVATLVSAYKLTADQRFADHAMAHLNAFFLDPATLMNPNLLYAQAIKGKVSGRGIGIIDTIHLIEVARAIEVLAGMGYLKGERLTDLKNWFGAYATWMNTHEYGLKEKDHGNNHSTWWAAQVATFAHLTGNEELMDVARSQFKKLLSAQMAADGGFPEELERTKPYNYTLFNLEGYAMLCEVASTPTHNLWTYEGEHGSIRKAWAFMLPFIKDKAGWQRPPDVQYFDQLPIQTTGLLLAAKAYEDEEMMAVWRALDPERKVEEVNRNFPIREPVLWLR
jgi:hypothetical protein